MHRYVWLKERGEIPNKYHVHHIDGNKANNSIKNLTLLHTSEHARLHTLEYIRNNKDKVIRHLKNINILAKEAKKTDRVREIQRNCVKKAFKTNDKIKSKCKICGDEIEYTLGFKKKVFCGKKCAASTKSRKDKKNQRERERYRLLHEGVE